VKTIVKASVALLVLTILAGIAVVGAMAAILGEEEEAAASSCSREDSLFDDLDVTNPINPLNPDADPGAPTDDEQGVVSGPEGVISTAQMRNAEIIASKGVEMDIPPRGQIVAITAALTESRLLNQASRKVPESLDFPHDKVAAGDSSSVGLFQTLTPATLPVEKGMDPDESSAWFYRTLQAVKGWQHMDVNDAAQAVERSAHPTAYAEWEDTARRIMVVLAAGGIIETEDPTAFCQSETGDLNCPATNLPAEKGLTPDALLVVRCVAQAFPAITSFGGVGERSANPTSDHPAGKAVDAMIPNWQTGPGVTLGDEVARYVLDNAKAFGVTYVIWNEKIQDAEDGAWRPYSHPSGATDPTNAHKDHVHVSVAGDAGTGLTEDEATAVSGEWANPIAPGRTPPFPYTLTARFGQCSSLWANCHTGLDFAIPDGTTVHTIATGRVIFAGWSGSYGNLVKVQHSHNVVTYYAHNSTLKVRRGDVVRSGQPVAASGSTGNVTGAHSHLEVRVRGNPVDPANWLANRNVKF